MEKLVRWIAKHKTLVRVISWILIVVSFSAVGIFTDMPLWSISIWVAILIFVSYVGVVVCDDILINKALTPLKDQCDPYPLLQETTEILTYPNQKAVKLHTLNYGVALREIGEYQKVYMLLRTVYPDGCPGLTDVARLGYYNNFMDVCDLLRKYDEADWWYTKAVQTYNELRNKMQKQQFDGAISVAHASYCFRHQDYVRTLQFLDAALPKCLNEHVNRSMAYAHTYLALGETEKAKEKLEFVIQNGNRLYAVTEARALLAQITAAEEKST